MWKTTWQDWVWLAAMVLLGIFASARGYNWSALAFGFFAGNQMQICLAGNWWHAIRKLYRENRATAISVFEREM
jgi:hypothetical protein